MLPHVGGHGDSRLFAGAVASRLVGNSLGRYGVHEPGEVLSGEGKALEPRYQSTFYPMMSRRLRDVYVNPSLCLHFNSFPLLT